MFSKKEVIICVCFFILGTSMTYIFKHAELQNQRKLTVKILKNSLKSMKASQSLAESCSGAYNVAMACVSNLNTCNIKEEAKKLDAYNTKRKNADQLIERMNDDMERIIEEVKTEQ